MYCCLSLPIIMNLGVIFHWKLLLKINLKNIHHKVCGWSICVTRYNTTKYHKCLVLHKHRYLIFYCPLNLFYKCVAFLPVKLVLVALKEVVRTRKIAAGVHHAHHAYHHGFFIMVIVGYVKGRCLPSVNAVNMLSVTMFSKQPTKS